MKRAFWMPCSRRYAAGVEIDPEREDYDHGRVTCIMNLERNLIELCEPPKLK
jgi:hypothetical protein